MNPSTENLAVTDDFALTDTTHDRALLQLGRQLHAGDYKFITVTPLTHQRNNVRAQNAESQNQRDVFGWNRPFGSDLLPESELTALLAGGIVRAHAGFWISEVRWASLGNLLFAHSAFPTVSHDAVFFGPDTYRFSQAIEEHLRTTTHRIRTAADIGCGSGIGAIVIAKARAEAQVLALDINPVALRFTEVNAELAGARNVCAQHSDLLGSTSGEFDLIVANPPYMQDSQKRAYRHGGERLGSELSVRIVKQAIDRLAPGGSLLLYTGSPWVDGVDLFFEHALPLIDRQGLSWTYREMDPDVFGEELDTENYAHAERIAAVVLTVTRTE